MLNLLKNKTILIAGGGLLFIGVGLFLASHLFFGAPQPKVEKVELFIIAPQTNEPGIITKLSEQGLIKNPWVFNVALTIKGKHTAIEPGGYYLSKGMDAWQIIDRLRLGPEMKWVVIPEGLRKEEIGEILADTFDWSQQDIDDWNEKYTRMKYDEVEGVYFPDTYLIPTVEKNFEVAQRLINRFNEKFAPYLDKFAEQDIMWTTGLRLASVIQREAAGKADMPLIAGILWNRLNEDMKLEVDATVQYARGKTEAGWWAPIKVADKEIDSPYNTYRYKGIPPHPIANPGLDAIEAVLNPQETDCLYYLHDNNKQIHCAKTYEEHEANIETYLK